MEKSKKMIKNLIIFGVLIGITFYMVLKDQDIINIYNVLGTVKLQYVAIAIICMAIYLILEAVNMGRTLKVLGEKSNLLKNIKYVLIGFFFSAITPAASGGQPMQIYYMHKDKISVGNATLALLINLSSFQVITLSFAFVSVGFNHEYMTNGLVWLFIVGVVLNTTALVLFLIGIFSKRLSNNLNKIFLKLFKFFKIKNVDKKQERMESELVNYQASAKYIKENKFLIVRTIFTTLIQITIYYTIPYWVYLSFNLHDYNILQVVSLQAVLYATTSGIPLPGAVGVTEGGFMALFEKVFTTGIVSSAMLLNRGVSFYLFVLITGIFVTIISIRTKKEENE